MNDNDDGNDNVFYLRAKELADKGDKEALLALLTPSERKLFDGTQELAKNRALLNPKPAPSANDALRVSGEGADVMQKNAAFFSTFWNIIKMREKKGPE